MSFSHSQLLKMIDKRLTSKVEVQPHPDPLLLSTMSKEQVSEDVESLGASEDKDHLTGEPDIDPQSDDPQLVT